MDFTVVCLGGVQIFRVDTGIQHESSFKLSKVKQWIGAEATAWNSDGSLLALAFPKEMMLISAATDYENTKRFPIQNSVKQLLFSPKSTYLMLSTRGTSDTEATVEIWEVSTCVKLFETHVKHFNKTWPLFTWTEDETYAFQLNNDGVKVFDGRSNNFVDMVAFIEIAHPQSCIPSPQAAESYLAVFKVEKTSKHVNADGRSDKQISSYTMESSIWIFDLKLLVTKGTPTENRLRRPVDVMQLGKASSVNIYWNTLGDAVIACCVFDCDDSHRYYEGSSSLYFYRIGQKNKDVGANVTREVVSRQNGPVHDVCWSPTTDEFILSCGPMPPQLQLCSGRTGDAKLSFGRSRRNMIRINPFGSMIAFGGFGNLPGDLDIWDATTNQCITSTKAPYTVQLEWAPDGRYLLGSTTSPRLRVDNCVTVYHYSGPLKARVDFEVLYSAEWRPVPKDDYTDRPLTPGRCKPQTQSKDSTVYRPPGSGALAAMLRAQRQKEQTQTAVPIRPGGGVSGGIGSKVESQQRLPPGADPITPNPKSKKKK